MSSHGINWNSGTLASDYGSLTLRGSHACFGSAYWVHWRECQINIRSSVDCFKWGEKNLFVPLDSTGSSLFTSLWKGGSIFSSIIFKKTFPGRVKLKATCCKHYLSCNTVAFCKRCRVLKFTITLIFLITRNLVLP